MKILIFTGAGCSVQFDLPTTAQFKNQFLKWRGSWNDYIYELFNYEPYPDIEYVLESIKDTKKFLKTFGGSFLNNFPRNEKNAKYVFVSQALTALATYEEEIMKGLFEFYQLKEDQRENIKKFYGGLFNLIRSNNDNKIDIATTNYDNSIENFCAYFPSEYTCIDGFEQKGGRQVWYPIKLQSLENYKQSQTPVSLLKIHGSLYWQNVGGTFVKSQSIEYSSKGDFSANTIIAPTVSPKEAGTKEPFKTLLELFKKRMEEADVCIVIGSSFRDSIINEPLINFVKSKKNLIIISPSAYQNYTTGLFENIGIRENTSIVEWAKGDVEENKRNVTFVDLPANQENNDKIFDLIKNQLEKT